MLKVTKKQPDCFSLSGRLDLESVMSYRREIDNEIPGDKIVKVDLIELEVIDSSALPLLVHIVRQARSNGGDVQFTSVPANLRTMAELAGLSQLLFLEG